ncbi:MAG: hypothetical protein ABW092_20520 [Candidatus Thiodiazotropha sp.]
MYLLENGVECDTLAVLASLLKPINEFEADDLFNKVLGELHITKPSDEAAIEGYVKVLLNEVIEKSLSPEIGIGKIYAANIELGYPRSLDAFISLEDEWYCEHVIGWSKERRDAEIVKACAGVVDLLKFPNVFKTLGEIE